MFDTIGLKQIFDDVSSIRQLEGWQPRFNSRSGDVRCFVLHGEKNSHAPRLTVSKCPLGLWHLRAECSLSAWLFGSNTQTTSECDLYSGLKALSRFIETHSGLTFDAQKASVSRVDFVKDYRIGEAKVASVIKRLADVSLPRMTRRLVGNSTIYFDSNGRRLNKRIRIYSKSAEVISRKGNDTERKAAKGILRLESSFMTTKSISALQTRRKLRSRTVKDVLTSAVADSVLDEISERLHLPQIIAENSSQSDDFEKLIMTHGGKRAIELRGFIATKRERGELWKLPEFGMSYSTYRRCLKDCEKAGVCP